MSRLISLLYSRYMLELVTRVRLWWRLIRDPRVSDILKLLLLGSALFYVFWPADLLPDIVPVLGQVDDALVVLLALRLFEHLVPPALVREHLAALRSGRRRPKPKDDDGDVIDGDYRVL